MKSHPKCLGFTLVIVSILPLTSCEPAAVGNSTYSVNESALIWGKMKPGGQLICTKRHFLHQGDYGEIILNPYWIPIYVNNHLEHTGPAMAGYLMPGDRLTVQRLQFTTSVTTAWLNVYTTDAAGRKIHVIVPLHSDGGAFDDKQWAHRGFRLHNTG